MLLSLYLFFQAFILSLLQMSDVFSEQNLENVSSLNVELVTYNIGLYRKLNVIGVTPAPNSEAGYRSISSSEFIKATTVISPELGYGLGFEYLVKTPKEVSRLEIEIVGVHPKMINSHGKEILTQSYTEELFLVDGVAYDSVIYWFSKPYEIVSGNWNFTIKSGNTILASQTFFVDDTNSSSDISKDNLSQNSMLPLQK